MKAKWQIVGYSSMMAAIILFAYLGEIPTQLHAIPFYDGVGHFALYGLWGYFFGKAFPKKIFELRRFALRRGTAIAIAIAVTEELVQQFSPLRTFSLADLAFGLFGIAASAVYLARNVSSNQDRKRTASGW